MTKMAYLVAVVGLTGGLAGCSAPAGADGDLAEGKPGATEDVGSVTQELSSGTLVANHIWWVKRTHFETMYLEKDDYIDWYTTPGTGNRDPVMVLIQYDTGFANAGAGCSVSPSAQATFKIIARDDDGNGNSQPRLKYTIPSSGCYALILYPYTNGDNTPVSMVDLHKDISSPFKWVCNPFGYCQWQRELLSRTNQSVPVTGATVRTPGWDFMTTIENKKGADPWVFVFNDVAKTGASNDDTGGPGGSVNSTIDLPNFKFEGGSQQGGSIYSVVLLAGYNTVDPGWLTPMIDAPTTQWWAYKR